MIIKYLSALLLAVLAMSCSSGSISELERFDQKLKEADKAEVRKDFVDAIRDVREAEQIATSIKWKEGIIVAKIRIATLQSVTDHFSEAEAEYLAAKELCFENSCKNLGSIYDGLLLLYSSRMKDISKARTLITEVTENADRLGQEEQIDDRLRRYASELREAGFEMEADDVERRVLELPKSRPSP